MERTKRMARTERTTLYQGRIFGVERVAYNDPAGKDIVYDVVRHPGAVTVVPVHEDGQLIMIRNWRVTVERWLHEFCAGKLEAGEDPAAAAARELEEETGFSAGEIRKVGEFLTSPGFTDERMHVYEARRLTPVPRRLEAGENIEVDKRSVAQTQAMIRDGSIDDGKTIAAFMQWRLWSEAPPQ